MKLLHMSLEVAHESKSKGTHVALERLDKRVFSEVVSDIATLVKLLVASFVQTLVNGIFFTRLIVPNL